MSDFRLQSRLGLHIGLEIDTADPDLLPGRSLNPDVAHAEIDNGNRPAEVLQSEINDLKCNLKSRI